MLEFFSIRLIFLIVLNIYVESKILSPKVVGDRYSVIRDFPYVAYIKANCLLENKRLVYSCGSSIINSRLLLSASHCVADCLEPSTMVAAVGHTKKQSGTPYLVDDYITHPDYILDTGENDIALLRIKGKLKFSADVARIALMKDPPYAEKGIVAGWGYINEKCKKEGDLLKDVDQYVVNNEVCDKLVEEVPFGVFCGASHKKGEYASYGDSGSALVVRGYIQIGIVAFKIPSITRQIVIYSDTGYHYEWISSNAKRLYCRP